MKCNLYKQQYSEKDPEKKGVRVGGGGVGGGRGIGLRGTERRERGNTQTHRLGTQKCKGPLLTKKE